MVAWGTTRKREPICFDERPKDKKDIQPLIKGEISRGTQLSTVIDICGMIKTNYIGLRSRTV